MKKLISYFILLFNINIKYNKTVRLAVYEQMLYKINDPIETYFAFCWRLRKALEDVDLKLDGSFYEPIDMYLHFPELFLQKPNKFLSSDTYWFPPNERNRREEILIKIISNMKGVNEICLKK